MHIIFVTTELAGYNHSTGGLGTFTANMARIFKNHGHKVTIILTSTKDESIAFDEDISLIKIYVNKNLWKRFDTIAKTISTVINEKPDEVRRFLMNIYKSCQVRKKINNLRKMEKIDLIHFCNLGALSLLMDKRIPYVVRISGFMNVCNGGANQSDGNLVFKDNKLSIRNRQEYYTLRKARHTVSPSNLLAEIARDNIRIDPAVIESPFVMDMNNWNYCIYNSLLKHKRYIIHYAGRLDYLKGTHIVAQVAKQLLSNYMDLSILLVGADMDMFDGSNNKIKSHELVQKSAGEYADRVIYVGCLVREQLYPLIQNSEVCLLPSRIENLPNACIEAMAMGKIVVGTNGASFEQLIDNRISGFLCERDNAESYLQAVSEALEMSSEEKKQMSDNAVKRVEKLAPDVIYRKWLEFYKKIIKEW